MRGQTLRNVLLHRHVQQAGDEVDHAVVGMQIGLLDGLAINR